MYELVPTKREKITFVCDADLKEALELWASEESRSVSNLCELLARKAVESRSKSATQSVSKDEGGELNLTSHSM